MNYASKYEREDAYDRAHLALVLSGLNEDEIAVAMQAAYARIDEAAARKPKRNRQEEADDAAPR